MRKWLNRILAVAIGLSIPLAVYAADWYEATGKPVARSLLSSSDLRTEFASIQTDIADKLPALTGNGDKIVVVNSGGTALTVASSGLSIAQGGTGATTAAGARTALGVAIGSDVQAWDTDLDAIAALANTNNNIIVGNGSAWVAESGSTARASLGVSIGSQVQAYDADLTALAALAKTDSNFIVGNGSTWVAETGATARTSLGLGSLATASTINNDDWSGTDLAVGNGGTGSSTASGARTALGVAIGSDVQAYDADLLAIGALAKTDSNFIVGNGSTWVAESGSTVRTSLGLGSLATASSISNTNWSGTDLAVANGGTGSSTAADARTALDVPQDGDVVHDTGNETIAGTKTFSSRPKSSSAGGFLSHASSSNTGGSIIITSSTPTDTSGMNAGDIKLVY